MQINLSVSHYNNSLFYRSISCYPGQSNTFLNFLRINIHLYATWTNPKLTPVYLKKISYYKPVLKNIFEFFFLNTITLWKCKCEFLGSKSDLLNWLPLRYSSNKYSQTNVYFIVVKCSLQRFLFLSHRLMLFTTLQLYLRLWLMLMGFGIRLASTLPASGSSELLMQPSFRHF